MFGDLMLTPGFKLMNNVSPVLRTGHKLRQILLRRQSFVLGEQANEFE